MGGGAPGHWQLCPGSGWPKGEAENRPVRAGSAIAATAVPVCADVMGCVQARGGLSPSLSPYLYSLGERGLRGDQAHTPFWKSLGLQVWV